MIFKRADNNSFYEAERPRDTIREKECYLPRLAAGVRGLQSEPETWRSLLQVECGGGNSGSSAGSPCLR